MCTLPLCERRNNSPKLPLSGIPCRRILVRLSNIVAWSRSTFISGTFPPPPYLTPYIFKINDQYIAGGGYGDVYKCRYENDGSPKEVAVKAFRFRLAIDEDASDKSVKMLRRELGIWRRLDHRNVVPFLGIAYRFGMEGTMSLVSLWMPNESLHCFLAKNDLNLRLRHRLQFLLDIANGLHYLHSFPVVHGDLTSNNVLLDPDYTARLVDFGYSSLAGNIPEALKYLQRSTTRFWALRWSAPELVETDEHFNQTPKSNVYSFGCVALEASWFDTDARSVLISLQVFSSKLPWSELRGDASVLLQLMKGEKPGRPESQAIDDSRWNFIQECWSSIEERPDADVIISTVQQFFSDCPEFPPLCELLLSRSSEGDAQMDASSPSLSPSKATAEDSRTNVGDLDDNSLT
ncbi:Protein kinase-like domain containing protein [Tylopilus felleus]